MPKPGRKDIRFDSADGLHRVSARFYLDDETPPSCVLQISHGMCEHMGIYEEFAYYMAANGIVVCGNDHIGHGATAGSTQELGHFGERNAREYVIRDLAAMNRMARDAYPGLPFVLLGHSMGSFFARRYASEYPETIDALILSGTSGPNPQAEYGIQLAERRARRFGWNSHSLVLYYRTFKDYLKRVKVPKTLFDWVSRDEEAVRKYLHDPLCKFRYTVGGFYEIFSALHEVSTPEWADALSKDLPVLLVSGTDDPVGDYGAGVLQVRELLLDAGVEDVTCILYPGARHEVLNEINRGEVYSDILRFVEKMKQSVMSKQNTSMKAKKQYNNLSNEISGILC